MSTESRELLSRLFRAPTPPRIPREGYPPTDPHCSWSSYPLVSVGFKVAPPPIIEKELYSVTSVTGRVVTPPVINSLARQITYCLASLRTEVPAIPPYPGVRPEGIDDTFMHQSSIFSDGSHGAFEPRHYAQDWDPGRPWWGFHTIPPFNAVNIEDKNAVDFFRFDKKQRPEIKGGSGNWDSEMLDRLYQCRADIEMAFLKSLKSSGDCQGVQLKRRYGETLPFFDNIESGDGTSWPSWAHGRDAVGHTLRYIAELKAMRCWLDESTRQRAAQLPNRVQVLRYQGVWVGPVNDSLHWEFLFLSPLPMYAIFDVPFESPLRKFKQPGNLHGDERFRMDTFPMHYPPALDRRFPPDPHKAYNHVHNNHICNVTTDESAAFNRQPVWRREPWPNLMAIKLPSPTLEGTAYGRPFFTFPFLDPDIIRDPPAVPFDGPSKEMRKWWKRVAADMAYRGASSCEDVGLSLEGQDMQVGAHPLASFVRDNGLQRERHFEEMAIASYHWLREISKTAWKQDGDDYLDREEYPYRYHFMGDRIPCILYTRFCWPLVGQVVPPTPTDDDFPWVRPPPGKRIYLRLAPTERQQDRLWQVQDAEQMVVLPPPALERAMALKRMPNQMDSDEERDIMRPDLHDGEPAKVIATPDSVSLPVQRAADPRASSRLVKRVLHAMDSGDERDLMRPNLHDDEPAKVMAAPYPGPPTVQAAAGHTRASSDLVKRNTRNTVGRPVGAQRFPSKSAAPHRTEASSSGPASKPDSRNPGCNLDRSHPYARNGSVSSQRGRPRPPGPSTSPQHGDLPRQPVTHSSSPLPSPLSPLPAAAATAEPTLPLRLPRENCGPPPTHIPATNAEAAPQTSTPGCSDSAESSTVMPTAAVVDHEDTVMLELDSRDPELAPQASSLGCSDGADSVVMPAVAAAVDHAIMSEPASRDPELTPQASSPDCSGSADKSSAVMPTAAMVVDHVEDTVMSEVDPLDSDLFIAIESRKRSQAYMDHRLNHSLAPHCPSDRVVKARFSPSSTSDLICYPIRISNIHSPNCDSPQAMIDNILGLSSDEQLEDVPIISALMEADGTFCVDLGFAYAEDALALWIDHGSDRLRSELDGGHVWHVSPVTRISAGTKCNVMPLALGCVSPRSAEARKDILRGALLWEKRVLKADASSAYPICIEQMESLLLAIDKEGGAPRPSAVIPGPEDLAPFTCSLAVLSREEPASYDALADGSALLEFQSQWPLEPGSTKGLSLLQRIQSTSSPRKKKKKKKKPTVDATDDTAPMSGWEATRARCVTRTKAAELYEAWNSALVPLPPIPPKFAVETAASGGPGPTQREGNADGMSRQEWKDLKMVTNHATRMLSKPRRDWNAKMQDELAIHYDDWMSNRAAHEGAIQQNRERHAARQEAESAAADHDFVVIWEWYEACVVAINAVHDRFPSDDWPEDLKEPMGDERRKACVLGQSFAALQVQFSSNRRLHNLYGQRWHRVMGVIASRRNASAEAEKVAPTAAVDVMDTM